MTLQFSHALRMDLKALNSKRLMEGFMVGEVEKEVELKERACVGFKVSQYRE